jgi:hypothetical protein
MGLGMGLGWDWDWKFCEFYALVQMHCLLIKSLPQQWKSDWIQTIGETYLYKTLSAFNTIGF